MSKPIYTAKFLEDDFTYLIDNQKWIKRLSYRIGLEEEKKAKIITALETLIYDLESKPDKTDFMIEKVVNKGGEYTYLSEVKLPEQDFNLRKEIEACFVASIIRYLILKTPLEKRDTTQAREEFRKRLLEEGVENSYADFMQNELGSDTELTSLYRFERAVLIAKKYISGNRNKGLFLSVGSLLEGSDDFTKYITGGHASKETKRRVMIIEKLCGIQPRKRMRKLAADIPKVQKESVGSLLEFADIALSRETEDFSSVGLIAEVKEEDNVLYREYVGRKAAISNPVRIRVYNKDSESLFYREVELLKKLNQRDCVVQMLGFFEDIKKQTSSYPLKEMNKPSSEVEKIIVYENSFSFKVSELVGANIWTIAKLWTDLMEAVHFVHSHDMVIRNLKPASIYLCGPMHNLRVKIGDLTFAERVNDVPAQDKSKKSNGEDEEMKMEVEDTMKADDKDRGVVAWKAEKEEVESRLDYALLKEFMFVAPEVFTKQAGFKADVWSLGLLGLFLVTHVIPWKEVQYVQEKGEEGEEESEQKMGEMLDRLSWAAEAEEGTEREDTVILHAMKSAIASCLHISVKQRASLLEVRNAVRQRLVNAKKARGEIILKEREIRNIASLNSFSICMRAVGAVSVFEKLKQEEIIMYSESQNESKGFKDASETLRGENKYRKLFRRLVHVVIAMHRFQKPNTSTNTSEGRNSSAKPSFSSPISAASMKPGSVSMTEHPDKTLLNGKFTVINTFLRTSDFECHIVYNNSSRRTQILKHIKVKSMQYESELFMLRSMSNEVAISEVEDYVEDMFQKYVTVGWLEGGWLMNVLNDQKVAGQHMSEKCLQSIARGLMSAMKHLHSRGIMYRGLNLSRVLAKRVSEDEMVVKLWDFGPAIMKEGTIVSPSGNSSSGYGGYAFPSAGVPSWMHYPEAGEDGYYCMAPELLRNLVHIAAPKQKYDERVDDWSVGMVFYLLAEGKSCFVVGEAGSVLESIERWVSSGVSLVFRNSLVSEEAKEVIRGLLRVSVNERLSLRDEKVLRWSGLKERSENTSGVKDFYTGENIVSAYGQAPSMTAASSTLSHAAHTSLKTVDNWIEGCDFGIVNETITTEVPSSSNVSRKRTSSCFDSGEPVVKRLHFAPDFSSREIVSSSFHQEHQNSTDRDYPDDPINIQHTVKELLQKLQNMKDCYLKYVEYQKAIMNDDFDRAEQLSAELTNIDESVVADPNRLKAAYSSLMEPLNNAMASWKEVVMKTPRLFGQYRIDSKMKKDLDNFWETLVK